MAALEVMTPATAQTEQPPPNARKRSFRWQLPTYPESTEGPSRTQLVYTVPIYLKAAKQTDFNPISPASDHPPRRDARLCLGSRWQCCTWPADPDRPESPGRQPNCWEWLKTDRQGLATLCGFDRIPSRSTLRKVFAELDALKNETRIVKTQITKLLRKERGKPKRETRGKPKAIAEGLKRRVDRDRVRTQKEGEDSSQRRVPLKRNRHWKKIEDYRKSRLDCALGIFQLRTCFQTTRQPNSLSSMPGGRMASSSARSRTAVP